VTSEIVFRLGFEVEDADCLQQAAATLERLGHRVQGGSADDAARRKVRAFIDFEDPSGNHIELVVRPECSGRRYFAARDAGIQHVNHQVQTSDDVLRSFYFLSERRVPIVFGPGRHPTSGARFLYFTGPDGMVFEYSVGVDEIEDEATHRPRQFGFEPTSFCMWGSKPAGMALPNKQ